MLHVKHSGIEVHVGPSERWKRRCLTFRWAGFADLLPEERFHRLIQTIPEDFRESRLKGSVWLELTPEETIEQFLAYPRSEDIAPKEPAIYQRLIQCDFFKAIETDLGKSPQTACKGTFVRTESLLTGNGFNKSAIRDAKLVFLRHEAYCDCQVVGVAKPALSESHGSLAGR